jgi:hypothetical protein
MISICCTYYRSLTLANLAAALFSIRQQNFAEVSEIVLVDNNTDDAIENIQACFGSLNFPVPVHLHSYKHEDARKTHSWSTNVAVSHASSPQVLFTRADYLLSFDAVERLVSASTSSDAFVVGGYYDLRADVHACERTDWRRCGPSVLRPFGREYAHTAIDSGVWFTGRQSFDLVGGLDERLTAYGHAQTLFQYQIVRAGVECVRLPEILFYHPRHEYVAPRDLAVAHQQLKDIGVSLPELWDRYDGPDHPHYDEQGVFHG